RPRCVPLSTSARLLSLSSTTLIWAIRSSSSRGVRSLAPPRSSSSPAPGPTTTPNRPCTCGSTISFRRPRSPQNRRQGCMAARNFVRNQHAAGGRPGRGPFFVSLHRAGHGAFRFRQVPHHAFDPFLGFHVWLRRIPAQLGYSFVHCAVFQVHV